VKRREFIAMLGGAASWPLGAAHAQQPDKLPTIGFLGTTTRSAWSEWSVAFLQRLRELGWIEGRTVAIEYRWAEGRVEGLTELASELVRKKVDVIVTAGPRPLQRRDEARGHPRRTTDQVRSRRQPDHRQSAWPRRATGAHRRADEVIE